MNDLQCNDEPAVLNQLQAISSQIGFTMPSDLLVGQLLRTLVASKISAHILELGTGMGLSLCWMADGLNKNSTLTSIDNDNELIQLVKPFFEQDTRINIICNDASIWLKKYNGSKFDLIFADAWPGKYSELDLTLGLLNKGGLYIVDDLLPQSNWPEGHHNNVNQFIAKLQDRADIFLTKISWSTGIIIVTKK